MKNDKTVNLSYSKINRAINAMTGIPYLNDKVFEWLKSTVIQEPNNIEKFEHLRQVCRNKTPIRMQPMRETRDIERDYLVDSYVSFKSKEYFEIGKGKTITKFRVHCFVHVPDILKKLEIDGNCYLLIGKTGYHIEEFNYRDIEELRLLSIMMKISGLETHLFECPNTINKDSSLKEIEKATEFMKKIF